MTDRQTLMSLHIAIAAMEGQDLPCMYLARHELESVIIVILILAAYSAEQTVVAPVVAVAAAAAAAAAVLC